MNESLLVGGTSSGESEPPLSPDSPRQARFASSPRVGVKASLLTLGAETKGKNSVAPWKLTRAGAFVLDAIGRRVRLCPPLEDDTSRFLYKLHMRRLRPLIFACIHGLLALALIETPLWCVDSGKCKWDCYPDFLSDWFLSTGLTLPIEVLLLAILAGEAIFYRGLLGPMYTSSGKSPSFEHAILWVRHGALATYCLDVAVALLWGVSWYRVAGYCRVILYVSVHRRTLEALLQMRRVLVAVTDAWVLSTIVILVFAFIGMVLFTGIEEGSTIFPDIFQGFWELTVLMTTCNFPSIMVPALNDHKWTLLYFLVFVGGTVFFLVPLSLAIIFNLFHGAQEGLPQAEEKKREHNIELAFELLDEEKRGWLPLPVVAAFTREFYDMRGVSFYELARLKDLMEEVDNREPEQPKIEFADFRDVVCVLDRTLEHAEWMTEVEWYLPSLYNSGGFQALTRFVKHSRVTPWPWACVGGGAGAQVADDNDRSPEGGGGPGPRPARPLSFRPIELLEVCMRLATAVVLVTSSLACPGFGTPMCPWHWVQVALVLGFAVTTMVNVLVFGWINCLQKRGFVFSLALTSGSLFLVVWALASGHGYDSWEMRAILSLRALEAAALIRVSSRLRTLWHTLLSTVGRSTTLLSVMFAWGFFMAVLGTQLFGGLVCDPTFATDEQTCEGAALPANDYTANQFYTFNFNDLPSGFLTLFVLIMVNDWDVIVDEFVDVTGSIWTRLFFIANYAIGVILILNLVTTMIINAFWDDLKDDLSSTSSLQATGETYGPLQLDPPNRWGRSISRRMSRDSRGGGGGGGGGGGAGAGATWIDRSESSSPDGAEAAEAGARGGGLARRSSSSAAGLLPPPGGGAPAAAAVAGAGAGAPAAAAAADESQGHSAALERERQLHRAGSHRRMNLTGMF